MSTKTFLVVIISILTVVFGQGCGKKGSGSSSGGGNSQNSPLSNRYFDEFMDDYSLSGTELPNVSSSPNNGTLRQNGYALTSRNVVVTVGMIFSDGRAEVADAKTGYAKRIEGGLTPRENGAHGLYEGYYAITKQQPGTVVYLEKVFADGRAEVSEPESHYNLRIETDLVPQKLGRYTGTLAITPDNRVVEILKVFSDGRAEVVDADTRYDRRIGFNLVPRKNRAADLVEGKIALTRDGRAVLLNTVFADGRAEVVDAYTGYDRRIERNLTPSSN